MEVYPDLMVSDITYDNVEDEGDTPFSRNTRFDLICKTEKDETVMVEVQKAEQEYFFERGLWTSSFKIRDQAPRGKWNYHLKGVYSIGILNFNPKKIEGYTWDDGFYSHTFTLREDKNFQRMSNLLRFTYIAIDNFHKSPEDLNNILEQWVYLLTNLKRLDGRPEELKGRIFERFFNAAEIARMSKKDQQAYRRRIMSENDWNNAVNYAEKKGRIKGKAEVARNLLSDGMPAAKVSEYTGLSEE